MKSLASLQRSPFCGQTPDPDPQVHALDLEAEAAPANMRFFKDHGDPHAWAGDILAHAGYLDDAERAYAKSSSHRSDPPDILWRAWLLYGHRQPVQKLIESTKRGKEATYLASFAPNHRAQIPSALSSAKPIRWRTGVKLSLATRPSILAGESSVT